MYWFAKLCLHLVEDKMMYIMIENIEKTNKKKKNKDFAQISHQRLYSYFDTSVAYPGEVFWSTPLSLRNAISSYSELISAAIVTNYYLGIKTLCQAL